MKNNHASFTLMGDVVSLDTYNALFNVKLLTGEEIPVSVSNTTYYEVLRNVGDEWRDRVAEPTYEDLSAQLGNADEYRNLNDSQKKLLKYIKKDRMVCIKGASSSDANGNTSYSARKIVLMHSKANAYGWEDTHWWIQQINTLFEQWLDVLFQSKREFTETDFSQFYRTNLDLLGGTTNQNIQESATMSRFLYGLSSSYLLTGNERALSAAKACSRYLINAYSSTSHDGKFVLWKFGREVTGKSTKEFISSLNGDDKGSFALYEQIYALSGLAQYYKATQDTWVLGYIMRTIASFQHYFLDVKKEGDSCYTGSGGYFSHIDPVTMRPDSPYLDNVGNKEKKNWNSIGDHIPAYLINLLSSIDPLPLSSESDSWKELRTECRNILEDCVKNILDHFRPDDGSKFVKERFFKDWTHDNTWGWQQDRGIVGHNLKISWNLTRCGHYFTWLADQKQNNKKSTYYNELASKCYDLSVELGNNMKEVGVDLIRGGIFDALERHPKNGLGTEFAWNSTKDFWQQEQAILAYYIMHQIDGINEEDKSSFLKLARYCTAFWNLFFVDQDNRKIYFRTTESGDPVIEGQYGIQAGHAIAGYHAFELNYLAHLYIRTFVDRKEKNKSFVLYFKPDRNNSLNTINVLPDFFRPKDIKIIAIKINGVSKQINDDDQFNFQIDISTIEEDSVIMVEYLPILHQSDNDFELRISKETDFEFQVEF